MTTSAEAPREQGSSHGVRIGTLTGVPVYLAPSWFLIAVVIVAVYAGPVLQSRPLFGLAIGVVQALVLLLCVLVHEAAHALTARAYGMPVLRIVANVWGGHTSMEAAATTPGRMAAVAAAGPVSNAVLAALAWFAVPLVGSSDVAYRVLEGLVVINGSLALLNILPGMPLDGGQVVECLVWKVTGDRNRGAVVAGWCGRAVTVLVVLWFFVRPLVAGHGVGFSSIWVLVIASVLWTGATESIRRGSAMAQLGRLRVSDVADRAVVVAPDSTIGEAVDHPDVVVTTDEQGRPTLVFGSVRAAMPEGVDLSAPVTAAVFRVPERNVVPARPGDDVDAIVEAMQESGVGTVVLTDEAGRAWAVTSVDRINGAAARN